MLSQLLGGIVGAAIVYGNYFHAINIFEGGNNIRTLKTAGLFAVYPVRAIEKEMTPTDTN
jgi:aquaglyceroporin related protein